MKNKTLKIKKSNKAQITLFIALGVALLIGASLIYFLSGKDRAVTVSTQTLDVEKVKNLVSECLKSSAENRVIQLGMQGGVIYDSQGGLFSSFSKNMKNAFYLSHEGYNVVYLIDLPYGSFDFVSTKEQNGEKIKTNLLLDDSKMYSEPPRYPWIRFPYIKTESEAPQKMYVGYFGINKMMPLLKSHPYSWQEELEKSITEDMKKCDINKAFGDAFTIKATDPKVALNFSNNAIFQLSMQVSVKDKSGAQKEFENLSYVLPINFIELHSFISNLIQNDVQDIKFDISAVNSSKYQVNIVHNVSETKDDIILVTLFEDKKVGGKPYKFKFARKNRPPALEYLDTTTTELTPGTQLGDLFSTSNLQVKALDPDEDDVAIKFYLNNEDGVSTIHHDISNEDCNNPSFEINMVASDGQFNDTQVFMKGTEPGTGRTLNFKC